MKSSSYDMHLISPHSFLTRNQNAQANDTNERPPHLCGLVLDCLPTLAYPLKNVLPVLVELELGDDDFRWSNADWDRLTVGLLAGDTLDVDDIFQTVDGSDLALTTFVGATGDENLVVLADWDGADL